MTDKIKDMVAYFEEVARHPQKSVIASMEETGKKAVGCFPYYTPEEIVYAAGMLPVGLWGGQTEIKLADKYLQSFCCSIMRENMEQGINGHYDFLSAVIIPAYCDTLKCIIENWKSAVPWIKLIPMVYPNNIKIKAGEDFLISEFERVKKEIENISGLIITEKDLNNSINVYEEYRETMRDFLELVKKDTETFNAKTRHLIIKASFFLDKKIYTDKLKELINEMKKHPEKESCGIRAVITGILSEPESLLDLFVENGISIVADDLAQESRQFRTSVTEGGSSFDKLVGKMTKQKCAMLYDEAKSRGQDLIKLVKDNNADAVVVCMLKFCDPEEFDFPIYKKELSKAKIPMLYLEIEQNMNSVEQLRTRIQGFAEMIGL